jgi:hypothetical protein
MPGAGRNPWPACSKKCRRQVPQVQPRHPGIPCAMVLTLIRALPRDRLDCPYHRATREHHRQLGISTGMPGPHDFTSVTPSFVRVREHAARLHVHRIPASRVVTIARNAPPW